MTQREIARLCCKITAIYALIRGIESLDNSAQNFRWTLIGGWTGFGNSWKDYLFVFMSALPVVLLIALSVFLWKQAGVVAALITGHNLQDDQNEPDSDPKPVNTKQLQAVAFATLGLWVIIQAIPNIINFIVWASGFSTVREENTFIVLVIARTSALIIQLGIGFLLLFSARGVVGFLYKLRNVGLDENERLS